MSDSTTIDQATVKYLCEVFKVYPKNCEFYNNFYNKELLPRIQKNYLAHLVASVEELVDEKLQKEKKTGGAKAPSGEKSRFYIGMKFDVPPGKKSVVECCNKCAHIKYKPSSDFKQIRIMIAHEIGHLLHKYKVDVDGVDFSGNSYENHANLFAFCAINGKDKFYHDKVEKLKYNNEKEIIDSIQKVKPIKEVMQPDEDSIMRKED